MSSQDPRQYLNDQEEASRLMLDGRQAATWNAMPGIVQNVNLAKMTVDVQIAIQGRYEDQNGVITFVNISQCLDVPICFPSGGGFIITFPIAAGDEVLLVFASRCIDSWWQNGGFANKPMEFRMHDLSDGFAIPGPRSQPNVVGSISATDIQMRTVDGSKSISLGPSGITIKGNLHVEGTILADGEITGGTAAIPLSTHVHSGVTAGGADTGAPV